jgi:hypothetical protein
MKINEVAEAKAFLFFILIKNVGGGDQSDYYSTGT